MANDSRTQNIFRMRNRETSWPRLDRGEESMERGAAWLVSFGERSRNVHGFVEHWDWLLLCSLCRLMRPRLNPHLLHCSGVRLTALAKRIYLRACLEIRPWRALFRSILCSLVFLFLKFFFYKEYICFLCDADVMIVMVILEHGLLISEVVVRCVVIVFSDIVIHVVMIIIVSI